MNTTSRRTLAVAAVSSTAAGALLLGSATPAFAHGSASDPAKAAEVKFTPPTLDQQKTWIENFIGYWQQALTTWGQKAAASTKLTDAQKATYASEVASAQQALTNLKAAVAAATTEDQLRTALKQGWAQFHWPTWPGAKPKHEHKSHAAKASADKAKLAALSSASSKKVSLKRFGHFGDPASHSLHSHAATHTVIARHKTGDRKAGFAFHFAPTH